ncbi:DUF7347 domain-containing protein [Candidatus Hodarchaeum mangrovi]
MTSVPEGDITEVLKALNHDIRREIIRILHVNNNLVSYSEFLNSLNLPASSNVAYHLSLLGKAHLIGKDLEGRYSLTKLGRRAALMLDLVVESKGSPFSDIYLGFSRLNPLELILGAWWIFFFILGLTLLQWHILLSLFFLLLSLSSILLFIYRTKTLWTLLLINNFIWIFFAPNNREILISIALTNALAIIFLFPEPALFDIAVLNQVIGIILLLSSIFLSFLYFYISNDKKLPLFLKKEERRRV